VEVHIAQFNIATLRHPLAHPDSVGYAALLDAVNATAEASPGFVWRHGIDSRDASTSVYENPLTLVNASVWETPRHLRDFTYKGLHRDVFRRRHEWFDGSGAVMSRPLDAPATSSTRGYGQVRPTPGSGRHCAPTPPGCRSGSGHPGLRPDPPHRCASAHSELSGMGAVWHHLAVRPSSIGGT
jgi:hypothetical protein